MPVLRSTPLYGALLGFAAATFLIAQEPQAPPGNAAPEPPAGAANGPQPGPGAKAPDAGQQPTSRAAAPGAGQRPAPARGNFFGLAPAPDAASVERGQALFVSSCGFCHGSSAQGGNSGPDLVRSVLVLHDEGSGTQIGPVILNGRPAKGMPKFNFSQAQIKEVADFLLARTQAAVNRMDYKILNVVTGNAQAGETYFGAHCASCHSGTGDLAHIAGKYEPVLLQSRFLYPVTRRRRGDSEGEPPDPKGQTTVTVTLPSGEKINGILDHIDDFSVALVDASGEHRSWLIESGNGVHAVVHDPLKGHQDLIKQYSDADMHNVLAYLETLK